MTKRLALIFISILVFGAKAYSQPITFHFTDIPGDDSIDIASNFIGQLSGDDSQVLFKISNIGPVTSFIGQIYFDDYDVNPLLSSGSFSLADSVEIDSLGGVLFTNANNLNLPQGNNISFNADFGQSADGSGSGKQGVDVGETAAFSFTGNFDAVLAAMMNMDLRVGIHVQGISPSGGSDSYVNTSHVPLPASVLLLGTGLAGIASFRRRFRRN